MWAESFHADGQPDMTNLRVTSRNLANTPKKGLPAAVTCNLADSN